MGYAELPRYTWEEVETTRSIQWYDVRVTVKPREDNPQWLGWSIECDGQSPWEGTQVVALKTLLAICQEFGDELINGPAGSIPQVAPSEASWI